MQSIWRQPVRGRAYADNPEQDKLLEAIDYVHLHGRSLYMTVNTLFKEQELGELYEYLLPYYRQGLDAVIVQDMGAFMEIRKRFPDLPVHASTQMTITGVYGAKTLYELGCPESGNGQGAVVRGNQ